MSRRIRLIAAVAATLIVAAIGYRILIAPTVESQRDGVPLAQNGLIAYHAGGDIFVGDPVSGTSTAIVTGPANDTVPIFSPDGLRIAFLRAESDRDGTIVVVRADGSDEHVVATEALTNGIPGYAWTPDSTSILLNHDSDMTGYFDGLLSLVDASGTAEPRLITPPLPAEIGYTYFSIYNSVAPMIRPSNGDEIALLGPVDGVISVVGIDGRQLEGFESLSLSAYFDVPTTRSGCSQMPLTM